MLAKLELLMGRLPMIELAQSFLADLPRRLAHLQEAEGRQAFLAHAHQLAGTAGTLGLAEISAVCRRLIAGDAEDAPRQLRELDAAIGRGTAALREALAPEDSYQPAARDE
jgi:HPt (histidine-containing phosphotransfer) domain-containing protein